MDANWIRLSASTARQFCTDYGEPNQKPVDGYNAINRAPAEVIEYTIGVMRFLLPAMLLISAGSVATALGSVAPAVSPAFSGSADPYAIGWIALQIVLLALFLFASVTAFKIPGTGVPESAALIVLAALLMPSIIRGDAQWYELALIAAGLLLICVEIFIIPGFGATGVGGIVLLTIGFLLAFLPTASPTNTITLIDLRNALTILVGGGLLGIVSFAWMSRHFPAVTGRSRLVLRETNAGPMPEHLFPAVGDVGVAITDLKPGGIVQLPDHTLAPKRVDVVSKRGFVPAGSKIVVTEVVGQVITVKPESNA